MNKWCSLWCVLFAKDVYLHNMFCLIGWPKAWTLKDVFNINQAINRYLDKHFKYENHREKIHLATKTLCIDASRWRDMVSQEEISMACIIDNWRNSILKERLQKAVEVSISNWLSIDDKLQPGAGVGLTLLRPLKKHLTNKWTHTKYLYLGKQTSKKKFMQIYSKWNWTVTLKQSRHKWVSSYIYHLFFL